jgi:hypothetical protein
MTHERDQNAPEQLVFIINGGRQGTDHVTQIEPPRHQATLGPTVVLRGLKVALPQVSILLQVKKKHVDRRAHELVNALLGRSLERDIHLV